MKKRTSEALVRKVDDNLTITELLDGKGMSFDLVIADLNGKHPLVVNKVSDRAYFILDGSGTVIVGSEKYDVEPNDLIAIKAKTPHGLEGNLRYIIVTSPPFDPNNESIVGPFE